MKSFKERYADHCDLLKKQNPKLKSVCPYEEWLEISLFQAEDGYIKLNPLDKDQIERCYRRFDVEKYISDNTHVKLNKETGKVDVETITFKPKGKI